MILSRVEAENQDDPHQTMAAKVWKEAFQYRLKETMPWYLTVLGMAQDAFKYGMFITHNYWVYREGREMATSLYLKTTESEHLILRSGTAAELPVQCHRPTGAMSIQDSPYLIHIMTHHVHLM